MNALVKKVKQLEKQLAELRAQVGQEQSITKDDIGRWCYFSDDNRDWNGPYLLSDLMGHFYIDNGSVEWEYCKLAHGPARVNLQPTYSDVPDHTGLVIVKCDDGTWGIVDSPHFYNWNEVTHWAPFEPREIE